MNYAWLILEVHDESYDQVSCRQVLLTGILRVKHIPHLDAASLTRVLGTQNGLAKLEYESLGIAPLSLNTLKKRANCRNNGWSDLDRLRIKALEHLDIAGRPDSTYPVTSRRTNAWYTIENKKLRDALRITQQDLVVMTRAYDKAFFNARSIAQMSGKAGLKELCAQREEEIRNELLFMSKREDDEYSD